MPTIKVSTLVILACLISGCTKDLMGKYEGANDVPSSGWRAYPSPTTGEPPGTLLAVSGDAVQNYVTNIPVDAVEDTVQMYDITNTRGSSVQVGALVNFVAKGVPVQVDSDATLSKKVTVQIVLHDVKHEKTDVLVAGPKVNALMQTLLQQNPLLGKNERLYFILETIKAKEFELRFVNSAEATADVKAAFASAVKANSTIHWDDSGAAQLKGSFGEYYRVFYLPKRIVRTTTAITGVGDFAFKDLSPDELVSVAPVRH